MYKYITDGDFICKLDLRRGFNTVCARLLEIILPINFINKLVYAKLTNHNFRFTVADFLDFLIVSVVVLIWVIVTDFQTSDMKYPFFSPEEDQITSVKFMGNIS